MIKNIFITFIFLILIKTTKAQNNGFAEVQLTDNNSDNRYSSYNRDGTLILFESNRDGHWQIYTMNIDGKNQKRLFKSDANDRRPTFHPDKNIILFESDRTGVNEIYTFNAENQIIKKIPIKLTGNKYFAKYFANGVELLFTHEEEPGNTNIYRVHKKGKLMKKLVDTDFLISNPKPNRRGNLILFHSNNNNDLKDTDAIQGYNIHKKEIFTVSIFKGNSTDASWPNRTNRIVFSHIDDKETSTSEIYTMPIDGSRKRRITFNTQNDILPHWSPNDINILVTRQGEKYDQIFKILLKEEL